MTIQSDYLNGKTEKIKVKYAHIKARTDESDNKVYFTIEYKPIDEDDIYIGFGSYWLDLVQKWLQTEFEIVETNEEDEKHDIYGRHLW